MVCGWTCFLAAIIIVGMVIMTMMMQSDPFIQTYEEKLSPELQTVYKKIVKERQSIFYMGYLIGFVVAILFLLFSFKYMGRRLSTSAVVCSVVAISFIVNHLYYILAPKTDYMVSHLNNQRDRDNWVEMYRRMQVYFHGSMVVGLVAVGVFGYAFRHSNMCM